MREDVKEQERQGRRWKQAKRDEEAKEKWQEG